MIWHWVLMVLLATLITQLVTLAFVVFQDQKAQGEFFYVPYEFGTDPVVVKRGVILLPAFLISGGLGFLITCLVGVFYSHRLAGPLHKLQDTVERVLRGEPAEPVRLRKSDELQELADSLNRLTEKTREDKG